ncbi:DUF6520 family protein [Pseudochryseolinea flava]|uniref:Uncharacterized protein n=1 Tax=Pseudochryseolinea flava TaxID=2059302 RepID=A0A364Y429_9BACT|nr:DUF6520 family protein [Pseudochryseolinea flava]RAW01573.1 hypothetical protein DQQ10_07900 [Pseudochryseolinea flava]
MKKIQMIFTVMAFMLAGVGVFATSVKSPVIDPRIDSNDPDIICDQQVSTECNAFAGQDCRYNDSGTLKTVHDKNSNCTLLYKQQ